MQYEKYEQYVEATKKYYEGRNLTIPVDLLILPESLFNNFRGIIEFGAGSTDLVNKCDCPKKCDDCQCGEGE